MSETLENQTPEDAPGGPAVASGDAGRILAVIDMGASAIRLVVAEAANDGTLRIMEEASRGVLLGKDTFTDGRIKAATMQATVRVLKGFRRIMEGYGVVHCRAAATSAVREASNRDSFLDRIRLRTGIEVEVIDGPEENRLTYLAVRELLGGHEMLRRGNTLLVEVGGGSADISFLRAGEPVFSGTYALGSIRMRQALASWRGNHDRRVLLLRRHIHNVVEDIKREMPLREATHFIALGGDVRFAASRLAGPEDADARLRFLREPEFIALCDQLTGETVDDLVERFRLPLADAETLVPALLAYNALLLATSAEQVTVPEASLRAGMLLDLAVGEDARRREDFSRQVLASAHAIGEKYRYDASHAENVARLAVRLFDELKSEHGLADRDRLLLEVASLLHDVGLYINRRAHHKHSQYILSVSDIFGLSRDDMDVVANVARYHRRAMPQKSHLPYMALDRDTRVRVGKLAAMLRIANALDADHLHKVRDLILVREEDEWTLEVDGAGDLTMERLATLARSDLLTEVFGQRVLFRESARP
jgi:exopolyphosphatase/guanosine-5'-triphosphate,3'-diphosphate pyrophosphatase